MLRSRRLVVAFAAAVAVVGAYFLSPGEIITAHALATIPLYDPNTVAGPWGTKLKTVGTLAPGETVQVIGCDDRKSDIDILVSFQNQAAVLGGRHGEYQLQRRNAHIWQPHATKTCRGFFNASSTVS